MEGNRVEFPIGGPNGVYRGDGIVQGVGLYDLGCIRDPMGKDGSGGEHEFEHVEGALAVGVKTPSQHGMRPISCWCHALIMHWT